MNLRSFGYRTDLIFPRFNGEISDRGNYLVIRTPSNPTYWWGNFLLFNGPPAEEDFERWQTLFAEEIGAPPTVKHMTFGWDTVSGEQGYIKPFLEVGFKLDELLVLTTRSVNPPPKLNAEVNIRPLHESWEWQAAIQNQIDCHDEGFADGNYQLFKERQFAAYRAMSEAGCGHWFGAFLGEKLVADLGVFTDGEVGRFQAVETHPDFRRRGICGTLVHQASSFAFEHMGAGTLVMVADEHYHAAKVYESVGFRPTEKQVALERSDPDF